MNTEEEVQLAEVDYRLERNGFEGSRAWNSFVVTDENYWSNVQNLLYLSSCMPGLWLVPCVYNCISTVWFFSEIFLQNLLE